jgi:hypothetical protein
MAHVATKPGHDLSCTRLWSGFLLETVMLDAEKARELFDYDPGTGIVKLKKDHGLNKAGQRAGRPKGNGRAISFLGYDYSENKFIVFLVTGHMPARDLVVRHINGINSDNRWENLIVVKPVSRAEEAIAASVKPPKPDKTSVRGIHFLRDSRKYTLSIKVDGEMKVVGEFDEFREAFLLKNEIEKKEREKWQKER